MAVFHAAQGFFAQSGFETVPGTSTPIRNKSAILIFRHHQKPEEGVVNDEPSRCYNQREPTSGNINANDKLSMEEYWSDVRTAN
jgi:hypothetical protein